VKNNADDGSDGQPLYLTIENAALIEFAQQGYDGAGMRGIARRAGIAAGTIYLHFRDKADLLYSLLDRRAGAIREAMHSAAEGDGATDEKIRAVIGAWVAALRESEPLAELLLRRQLCFPAALRRRLPDLQRVARELIGSLLRADPAMLASRGEADLVAQTIVGAVERVMLDWLERAAASRSEPTKRVGQAVELILRGLNGRS